MAMSTWFAAALLAGGVGYLALAAFVWANRRVAASGPLVTLLLAVKAWTLCYALELVSTSAEVAQWWSALKFIGIVALPPALWAFVWEYTGRGRLPSRWLALLLVHPVLVLASFAIPATNHLIHRYPALIGRPLVGVSSLHLQGASHAGVQRVLGRGRREFPLLPVVRCTGAAQADRVLPGAAVPG